MEWPLHSAHGSPSEGIEGTPAASRVCGRWLQANSIPQQEASCMGTEASAWNWASSLHHSVGVAGGEKHFKGVTLYMGGGGHMPFPSALVFTGLEFCAKLHLRAALTGVTHASGSILQPGSEERMQKHKFEPSRIRFLNTSVAISGVAYIHHTFPPLAHISFCFIFIYILPFSPSGGPKIACILHHFIFTTTLREVG